MFYFNCDRWGTSKEWLSLENGFLVPLDDVRDLLLKNEQETNEDGEDREQETHSELRADLISVDLSRRGALQFTFVEVKYRRLLKSALDIGLRTRIAEQTTKTRTRWQDSYFSSPLAKTQLAVRRKRLARALRFYLDKARRHRLSEEAHKRLDPAIDRLFRSDTDYTPEFIEDRGYIFCPEHHGSAIDIDFDGQTRVYLFGPQGMPDSPVPAPSTEEPPSSFASKSSQDDSPNASPVSQSAHEENLGEEEERKEEVSLLLGHALAGDTPVNWTMSIRGNPHLMIVGLPGMGKTTCIINLCEQLLRRGIVPLVFSYHDDIEAKLGARVGTLSFADIDSGLGFNPLRVVGGGTHGWIDNVGMLRDIFASVYSDFGDLQTNEIREAIKQSYSEQGYGLSDTPMDRLPVPDFQRFFDLLKQNPKPNPGIIARLEELNDYGFLRGTGEQSSLRESQQPTIMRLYVTQNEVLQNAMSSFILLNIYQNVFLRGVQPMLTHAVIFDEAHRASRLKLLPTMAKECRKFGLSLLVASQEAKDFSPSLYAAIANYLVFRATDTDAKAWAKNVVQSAEASDIAGRMKQLEKYTAVFFCEGKRPTFLRLLN